MRSLHLGLLVQTCLTTAKHAIDIGTGPMFFGLEGLITDFAVLTNDNLDDLTDNLTICSSTTAKAFTNGLNPFQLYQENGKPWLTIYFFAAQKTGAHHRVNILVSCPSFRLLKKEKLFQVPVAIIVHGKSEERDAYQDLICNGLDFVMHLAGEYA